MFRKFTLLIAAIVCFVGSSRAQNLQPCSTDEHYHQLLAQHPELADYEKAFNEQLGKRLGERKTSTTDTTVYDVPLVLHVVHDYGSENLADTVLYDAVRYWTVIYMLQNGDSVDVIAPFKPYIGNTRIRFHLATIDPNGKPTKGIVRTNTYLTSRADDEAKLGQWPQNKYINIWFVSAFGAAYSGAAAYATPPILSLVQPYYDGIICLSSYAGVSDPTVAKTVPHEMGHILNLAHTWGNTNAPGVACGDDQGDDTPPTKGHNPSGCTAAALYDTTCATGYMKTYLSVLTGLMDSVVDYPDTVNSQNIMDYTYCDRMFSKGQSARMRAALTSAVGGRNNLYSPANLAATGALAAYPDLPPVADFIVNRGTPGASDARSYFLTVGNAASFVFRNASWNDTVSSVAWSFSNGATTPTSTSMTTVNNKFATPGWVSVSLIANSNAGSDTITNTQAVYAADTVSTHGMGYSQQFASAGDISNWPMFNFYNNEFKWEFYSGGGVGDTTCLRYRSWDGSDRTTGNAYGDHDDIYTPAFDLADATDHLYLNFYTTGAYTHHGIPSGGPYTLDTLEVDASTNGGKTWAKISTIGGASLANNNQYGYEFTPTSATAWIPRSISVPLSYRTAQTFFRIRYRPGNTGNDLYLDNFYFDGFPAGVKENIASAGNTFTIFPNPSADGFNMVFKTGNTGEVTYVVRDLAGKVVFENKKTFNANSLQQESVSRSATPVPGIYFITVTIDGVNMNNKVVIY